MGNIRRFDEFVNEAATKPSDNPSTLKKELLAKMDKTKAEMEKIVAEFDYDDVDDLLASNNLEAKDQINDLQEELQSLEEQLALVDDDLNEGRETSDTFTGDIQYDGRELNYTVEYNWENADKFGGSNQWEFVSVLDESGDDTLDGCSENECKRIKDKIVKDIKKHNPEME